MTTIQIFQSAFGALGILAYVIWGRKFIILKQAKRFNEMYKITSLTIKKSGLIEQNMHFDYIAFDDNYCYTNFPVFPFFIYKLEIIERDDKNLTLTYKGGTYKLRIMSKENILTNGSN
ncbi:hypothetical protein LNTAR_24883 [Lentisphaera araneosa HTCC2155]|uniref:Uncharacterized protein n=1 Tax=Lentisphaera araneosa HTCC2155 TaxID=313628 RepID=A6DSY4_9BACT|nr:hypothetical protein [Lentisphaera araneosa]EDM25274.1 hypothetical protein LNTAR_24883 [Lentisphaera araneosa HTCC2155]